MCHEIDPPEMVGFVILGNINFLFNDGDNS
jgi:hypothetical protein